MKHFNFICEEGKVEAVVIPQKEKTFGLRVLQYQGNHLAQIMMSSEEAVLLFEQLSDFLYEDKRENNNRT